MIGISPYQGASPVRLFAEKTGMLPDEEDEETIEKRVGHAIEPALVKLYEEESGRKVLTVGEYVESVVHPEHSWARCNLDARIDGARIGLEIKHVGIGMHVDWDLDSDDGIPNYVRTQTVWQCLVAGLDEVHVVVLCAGRFRVFYTLRDLDLESALFEQAKRFWGDVVARKLPTLDGSAAARALLEAMYPPPPKDVVIEADANLQELLANRIAAHDAEGRAAERKEILNNLVREAMGKQGATVAMCSTAKAIWRVSKSGQRPLRVDPMGEAKRPRQRKGNAERLPVLVDDEEVF